MLIMSKVLTPASKVTFLVSILEAAVLSKTSRLIFPYHCHSNGHICAIVEIYIILTSLSSVNLGLDFGWSVLLKV